MKKRVVGKLFNELSIAKMTIEKEDKNRMGTNSWSSSAYEARVCLVRDYISKHSEAWWFIENMHNIYFMYGHENVEQICNDKEELKWDDILPEPLLTMKRKREYFPLGFVMVAPNPVMEGVYGIDHLEVLVKGYNLGNKLIDLFYRDLGAKLLIPLDIITVREAFGYWKKFLREYFDTEDDFWTAMKKYKIPTDLLIGYDDDPIWDDDDDCDENELSASFFEEMESWPKKIKNT